MMTIRVRFFDKKTELLTDDIKLDVPDDLVHEAAQSTDVNYINARPFEMTDNIKNYVIQSDHKTKKLFEVYDYDFIGRHGLGPEYD